MSVTRCLRPLCSTSAMAGMFVMTDTAGPSFNAFATASAVLPWVMNIQPSRVAFCAASFPITAFSALRLASRDGSGAARETGIAPPCTRVSRPSLSRRTRSRRMVSIVTEKRSAIAAIPMPSPVRSMSAMACRRLAAGSFVTNSSLYTMQSATLKTNMLSFLGIIAFQISVNGLFHDSFRAHSLKIAANPSSRLMLFQPKARFHGTYFCNCQLMPDIVTFL
ncbi:exported protein of unknown function (plasmid) [Rhizobium leguminosarum]|uniref:Uncharacterized protein n=1 Tax=Rhizobium leguminosarum TaxID=384 RepID=A0A2K9ZG97_RHILE|nr:exported protein of unknown function [Rhizobium leguminosarum]